MAIVRVLEIVSAGDKLVVTYVSPDKPSSRFTVSVDVDASLNDVKKAIKKDAKRYLAADAAADDLKAELLGLEMETNE
jgi:hypothetical protein